MQPEWNFSFLLMLPGKVACPLSSKNLGTKRIVCERSCVQLQVAYLLVGKYKRGSWQNVFSFAFRVVVTSPAAERSRS